MSSVWEVHAVVSSVNNIKKTPHASDRAINSSWLLGLVVFVATIAKWLGSCCFTATEIQRSGLLGIVAQWRKAGIFVRAVAKWLAVTQAASAPEVGLAGLYVYGEWRI